MVVLILELTTCICSYCVSLLYENKALLVLGEENYKIRLGKFKKYDKHSKKFFFPTLSEKNKCKFYKDYILFFVPGINIVYSFITGMKKCNTIINDLKKENIIVQMNEEEKEKYECLEGSLDKISFVMFNSMDSYKSNDMVLDSVRNCESLNDDYKNQIEKDLSDYYAIQEDWYKNDVSYVVSLFGFSEREMVRKRERVYKNK